MVVLSAAIVAQGESKTLLARQFAEMTRLQVDSLLSAFPYLLESGRDHTFIETDAVRYLYQPMESLYLCLLTSRSSNLLEDLDTLRLLAKVVQDCCQIQVTEELVLKNVFNIVFAFDEVISFGHRKSVTLSQIKTYTEMYSHEEALESMLKQSKINEAREMAKKREQELARARRNQQSIGMGAGRNSSAPAAGLTFREAMTPAVHVAMERVSTPGPNLINDMEDAGPVGPTTVMPGMPKKGMSLGKKMPGDALTHGDASVVELTTSAEPKTVAKQADETTTATMDSMPEPVMVNIEEKIVAHMKLDGGLVGDASCVGELQLTVLDEAKADVVCFKLAEQDTSFVYSIHPSLHKESHRRSNVLEVREGKTFKVDQPLSLLRWRGASTQENYLPISFSCWPSATPDGTTIVLEFELTDYEVALEDVHLRFPATPSARAAVSSAEPGEALYDSTTEHLHWHIERIDGQVSTGILEFSAATDIASLLPCIFEGKRMGSTKCLLDIQACYHQETRDPITFGCNKSCTYTFTIGL